MRSLCLCELCIPCRNCVNSQIDEAVVILSDLWRKGYSPTDIITTLFRVVKYYEPMDELYKLEAMKACIIHMCRAYFFESSNRQRSIDR